MLVHSVYTEIVGVALDQAMNTQPRAGPKFTQDQPARLSSLQKDGKISILTKEDRQNNSIKVPQIVSRKSRACKNLQSIKPKRLTLILSPSSKLRKDLTKFVPLPSTAQDEEALFLPALTPRSQSSSQTNMLMQNGGEKNPRFKQHLHRFVNYKRRRAISLASKQRLAQEKQIVHVIQLGYCIDKSMKIRSKSQNNSANQVQAILSDSSSSQIGLQRKSIECPSITKNRSFKLKPVENNLKLTSKPHRPKQYCPKVEEGYVRIHNQEKINYFTSSICI